MAVAKTKWIVLHNGLAKNVKRHDYKGNPILGRDGKAILDQISFTPGEPYQFEFKEAERLMERGYARKARVGDFEGEELPSEFAKTAAK